MRLPSQRKLFEIPEDIAYFNCAYMSPLMKTALAAGRDGMNLKATPWVIRPPDFFSQTERARALFANLIECSVDDVCIIPSCSYGTSTAAHNLPVESGQSIIVLADQFPSNVYPWKKLAEDCSAQLKTVSRPNGEQWTDSVLEAIETDSALVALPQCHWIDGSIIDLQKIGLRCREVGAALVVDLTQSAGALPLDLKRVKPDFAIAAAYKWLLGPYSIGFMYVAPRWQTGNPLEHNWLARKGSQDFTRLIDYNSEYQPGARRYDVGESANFALIPAAVTALEKLLFWGVSNIQETLCFITQQLASEVSSLGLHTSLQSHRAGHFLGVRFPESVPEQLSERLAEQGVYISIRGDTMRITPHLYNDERDLDRLTTALRGLVS